MQLAELLVEVGDLLALLSGVEVAQGGVGLAVEGLTRESALLGVPGDVAVSAQEDGAGTGESLEGRYDTHG